MFFIARFFLSASDGMLCSKRVVENSGGSKFYQGYTKASGKQLQKSVIIKLVCVGALFTYTPPVPKVFQKSLHQLAVQEPLKPQWPNQVFGDFGIIRDLK